MNEAFGKVMKKYHMSTYGVFRIFVGLFFFLHGAQKLFGLFGMTEAVPLMSLIGFAGAVELLGGLAIACGFLTRLAAFGTGMIMIGAYVKVHLPSGLNPLENGGELALLYLLASLVILTHGAGQLSLEKALFKKEFF